MDSSRNVFLIEVLNADEYPHSPVSRVHSGLEVSQQLLKRSSDPLESRFLAVNHIPGWPMAFLEWRYSSCYSSITRNRLYV